METLYALTHDFEKLFDSYDEIYDIEYASNGKDGYVDDDGNPVDPAAIRDEMQQAWFDTLDAMECEITDKAANTALYIKNINADIKALEAEKKALEARIKSKKAKKDGMQNYLLCCLEAAKLETIDTPKVYVQIKDNPPSLEFTDENAFIGWAEAHRDDLLKYSDPEPRRDFIKKLIKSGEEIPYTEIVQKKRIEIK